MTFAEKRYAGATLRISLTLVLFLLLMLLRGVAAAFLPTLTAGLSDASAQVAETLLQALCYALCFLLPAWAFFLWPNDTHAVPLDLSPRMPRGVLHYVFFGVAVTGAAAFFNAQIVNIFHYGDFSSEVLWESEVASNLQLALMLVELVVVPAFVEELLFRGVILSNLLPFGKGTAVLGSALLFGLMHQNAEQLLYATAAGVVLGWIFVQTYSIWPCVLMHFVNNFHSVLQTALLSRLPGASTELALYVLQGVLMALGIFCGIRLLCKGQQGDGNVPEVLENTDVCALSVGRRVRLFFNVPMILFVAWCIASMLLLIMMSMAMYY